MPTVNADNKSRIIQLLTGITGVASPGNAIVNIPTNQRYHRIVLQCTAVNYTAPVAAMPSAAGGTPATFTVTVVNRAISAIAIATAGSGQTPGTYNMVITDPTGVGAAATVVVAGGGTVTATPTVTNPGIASPINPVDMLDVLQQQVNGVMIRDVTPDQIMRNVQGTGYDPQLGELPLYYTNPQRNMLQQNEVTSWDMFGQSTFQIRFGIKPNLLSPGITGIMEFDYMRNVMDGADGKPIPFLQPVSKHAFTFPLNVGENVLTTLPIAYPIIRLWFLCRDNNTGAIISAIDYVSIYQDNNKVLEGTKRQVNQAANEYGFVFGEADWLNTTYPTSDVLKRAYNAPSYYETAYFADIDQRWWKALKVLNQLQVRVTVSQACQLTILQETMPGAYNG